MKRIIASWIRTLPCTALTLSLVMTVQPAVAGEQNATDKREMLSKHQTVAQFDGVTYHRCPGRTSMCPDRRGDSGDWASFRVLKYLG
jgi:hypothetical protein